MKDFQDTGEHQGTSKHEIFELFSWSCWSILPSWIRIHNLNKIRVQSENEKPGKLEKMGGILPRKAESDSTS